MSWGCEGWGEVPTFGYKDTAKVGSEERGAKERGRLVDAASWLCVLYWSAREAILLRAVTNIGWYSEQYRFAREGLLLCVQPSRCLGEWCILGASSSYARVYYIW